MKALKHFVLLAVLALPALYLQGQVEFSVQIGPDYGFYNPPPVCAYGYFPYYPFACAPYGYWAPAWFVGGQFVGVGPWYNFYYRYPGYWTFYGGGWHHGHDGHGYYRYPNGHGGYPGHPYYGGHYGYGRPGPYAGGHGYPGPGRYPGGHGFSGGGPGNYGGGRGYGGGGSHGGGHNGGSGSHGGNHR